ncbi:sensor histidine kinase [Allosalinactinospora lopnorensis]|uniref:sensor histidine kinase n=1 Tax=Allosalinactinospora lopnorensis TaxID=1352348 RepID=UPI000A452037
MSATRQDGPGGATADTPAAPSWWFLLAELATLDGGAPARRTGRDWAVDVLLFLFAVLVWAGVFGDYTAGEYPFVPDWLVRVDLVLGAAACLGVWCRRRFPLAFAAAMIPVSAASSTGTGALMVALVTLAVHRPWRQAAAVAVLCLAAGLPWIVLLPPARSDTLFLLALASLLIAACTGWGTAIRARRQLVVRLRTDAERERDEQERRLAHARREERQRIAGEMHDVLAHRMSLLSVHAGALAYRTARAEEGTAPPLESAELNEAVRVIRDNAHQALDELGEVLAVLRSTDTGEASGPVDGAGTAPPQPRLADIVRLVDEAARAGQRVSYEDRAEITGNEAPRPQVQRTAYRTVQEGLTNARKHAPDARVTVQVTGTPRSGLDVTVTNPLPVGVAPAEIPGPERG